MISLGVKNIAEKFPTSIGRKTISTNNHPNRLLFLVNHVRSNVTNTATNINEKINVAITKLLYYTMIRD